MADFDDEESSGDEESSADEENAEEMGGEQMGEGDMVGSQMAGVEEVGIEAMDTPPGPRFPDMPQYAIAPRQIPNVNLFPTNCEDLIAPPFATQESSKLPYAILFLGFFLLLLLMLN